MRVMKSSTQCNLLDDYHLLSYDVLDSTNEEAKRLAGGGASHGAVIWAKRQMAGRGRMGREWISPEGNLYVSILLSPPCALPECSQLSFVSAVAAANTVEPIIGDHADIHCKWPNDVLIDGKKAGGILLESFTIADENGEDKQWVVTGLGLNIDSYPEDVAFPATSLRDQGVEIISAKIVLSRFIYHFIHAYDSWCRDGFATTREDWLKRAYRLGYPTDVAVGDQHFTGSFQGIDNFGRLLLQDNQGGVRTVSAGDVVFRESGN